MCRLGFVSLKSPRDVPRFPILPEELEIKYRDYLNEYDDKYMNKFVPLTVFNSFINPKRFMRKLNEGE